MVAAAVNTKARTGIGNELAMSSFPRGRFDHISDGSIASQLGRRPENARNRCRRAVFSGVFGAIRLERGAGRGSTVTCMRKRDARNNARLTIGQERSHQVGTEN